MIPQNFTETFLAQIQPGWRVLDLGAGNGHFSRMFATRGARVTAVEPKFNGVEDKNFTVIKIKLEDFIENNPSKEYDAVFMRNILQFLDKEWVFEKLFPWLKSHISLKGVIGIETFFKNPIPPFESDVCALYSVQELGKSFSDWQILLADGYEHFSSDLQGNKRQFFTSDLIVKKLK